VALLGGGGLALAHHHEADEIHIVEGNRQLFELIDENLSGFSGGLYGAPEVRRHVIDARGFLARSRGPFDLIIQEVGSGGAAGTASAHSITETYAYTVEAFQLSIERLSDTGVLAIGGELGSPPRTSMKLFATAAKALELSGRDPREHVVAIRSWNQFVILVKPSGVSNADVAAIRTFCKERFFDLAYLPGMAELDANRYNHLDEPVLFRGARALLGPARERFIRDYKFRLAPATDDRPYFFQFFRWSALGELLELRARGGTALLEVGYLVLIAVLLQAALAGFLIILLPLILVRSSVGTAGIADRSAGRIGLYFLCLGLGFLFLEIAFIQRLTLLLAQPLIAAAVVLAGFLFFAGLGSGASQKLEEFGARKSRDPIRLAATGIVFLVVAYLFALPPAFARAMTWPITAKVLLALGVIAPLAFLLGMPFPLGLRRVASACADLTPWAWGVNGWASVLSAVLATLLAVHWGFSTVVIAACCLYLVAAWSAPPGS
ncbi:MAG: SAM-dependent methyltransferase, partial [Acidobacteriota bacterium]|nr:SAM-dependent methyltransferase [Acidobacteriota bacterium]